MVFGGTERNQKKIIQKKDNKEEKYFFTDKTHTDLLSLVKISTLYVHCKSNNLKQLVTLHFFGKETVMA